MEISVQELLECEYFTQSKILAGHGGFKNIITSVTVLDSPDAHHYYKGGEIVLTTGYGFLRNEIYQSELIGKMVEKQVAVLAIQLRFYDNKLPHIIKSEANRLNFPVIDLPVGGTYRDIYDFISSNLMSKETKEIKKIPEVFQDIYDDIMEKGFVKIARTLYKWTGLDAIVAVGNDIFMYHENVDYDEIIHSKNKWNKKVFQISFYNNVNQYYMWIDNKYYEWVCSEIIYENKTIGHILLIKSEKYISSDVYLLLSHCTHLVTMETRIQRDVRKIQRKYDSEFIRKIISKVLDIEEFRKEACILGYELYCEGMIVLFSNIDDLIYEKINKALFMDSTFSGFLKEDLVLAYMKYSPNLFEKINEIGEKFKNIKISVGSVTYYDKIYQSYEEAMCALELGHVINKNQNVFYFMQLGFYRFFKSKKIAEESAKYYEEYLNPLKGLGKENYKTMLDTLDAFIKNSYAYRETAKQLFVHPNTVRYRIAFIEKQCNINFKNAEDRLNMEIALKILPLIGSF